MLIPNPAAAPAAPAAPAGPVALPAPPANIAGVQIQCLGLLIDVGGEFVPVEAVVPPGAQITEGYIFLSNPSRYTATGWVELVQPAAATQNNILAISEVLSCPVSNCCLWDNSRFVNLGSSSSAAPSTGHFNYSLPRESSARVKVLFAPGDLPMVTAVAHPGAHNGTLPLNPVQGKLFTLPSQPVGIPGNNPQPQGGGQPLLPMN